MNVIRIMALAVALGADAMSVSMAIAVRWSGPGQRFRLAWHMGLFQFLMPLVGWLAGREVAGLMHSAGRYLAAGLLAAVAGKMLYEALGKAPGSIEKRSRDVVAGVLRLRSGDPTRGWSLILLSLATSVDALAAGFSLALKGGWQICRTSAVIGIVTALMVLAGMAVGKRAGKAFGRPAEIAGAAILLAVAASFLWG